MPDIHLSGSATVEKKRRNCRILSRALDIVGYQHHPDPCKPRTARIAA
jgi:hypothetical protein